MVFLLVLTVFLWVKDARAQDLAYNPINSPIPVAEMEEAIEYGIWSLTSRVPIQAEYTGLTGAEEVHNTIVIQWADWPEWDAPLGRASWTRWTVSGEILRGKITLNSHNVTRVDACLRELIVHELIHSLTLNGGHSPNLDDVMFKERGHCRYSPSLDDLSLFNKPIKSCHVELTPDNTLEVLDYNGNRISLSPLAPSVWTYGDVYRNPLPRACSGVHVAQGEVYAEIKSFRGESGVYRFRMDNGLFTRF